MTTVWVTKYALTDGIKECEIDESVTRESVYIWATWPGGTRSNLYRQSEAYRVKDDALAHAERMREKKIKSLRKQIEKLEAMTFEVKP